MRSHELTVDIKPLEIDTVESPYELMGTTPLGSGSTGTVWLATDKATQSPCALKVVDAEFRDALLTERERLRAVYHPNIVREMALFPVLDGDAEIVQYALVLEYLEGGSLRSHLRDNMLPSPETVRTILVQLLDALQELHHRGMAHGDLRPENLVCRTEGDLTSLVLIDLGFVNVANERRESDTRYWSPERLTLGTSIPSAKDDVFSLGVIMGELLRKKYPLPKEHKERIALYLDLPQGHSARSIRIDGDLALGRVLSKMMVKDPNLRPTAGEALRMLSPTHQEVEEEPISPKMNSRFGIALVGCALFLGGTALGAWSSTPEHPSKEHNKDCLTKVPLPPRSLFVEMPVLSRSTDKQLRLREAIGRASEKIETAVKKAPRTKSLTKRRTRSKKPPAEQRVPPGKKEVTPKVDFELMRECVINPIGPPTCYEYKTSKKDLEP